MSSKFLKETYLLTIRNVTQQQSCLFLLEFFKQRFLMKRKNEREREREVARVLVIGYHGISLLVNCTCLKWYEYYTFFVSDEDTNLSLSNVHCLTHLVGWPMTYSFTMLQNSLNSQHESFSFPRAQG